LSRIHFLTGIISYVSSPMWLALLLLSSLLSAIEAGKRPVYFLPGLRSLPHWPQFRSGEIVALFALTLAVLLLPKVLGALLALRDRALLRQYGGAARLGVSLLIEQMFSVLLAPSMMLFHSAFVVQTLCGRTVSWNAQERSDRGVTLREAWRRQWWHLLVGVAWGAVMWRLAPQFFWWLTPVLLGLICSVWLTAWTSRASVGRLLRRGRLLLTPEETAPPRELLTVRSMLAAVTPPPPQRPPRPAPGGGLRPVYQAPRRKSG
jgi:membrane glycosyltransferase